MSQSPIPILMWHRMIPLLNFDCPAAIDHPITLGTGAYLTTLSDDDKQVISALVADTSWGGLINLRLLSQAQYKLAWSYEAPPTFARVHKDASVHQAFLKARAEVPVVMHGTREDALDTLTCLRLLKAGLVGADVEMHRTEPHYQGGRATRNEHPLPHARWSLGPGPDTYILTQEEIPALQALVTSFQTLRERDYYRFLSLGLRRFNLAYGRDLPDDRLIDLAVVLESTLLSELRDELSYRLTIRGATLLSLVRDPEDTHAHLQAMYKARSSVVHNGETLADMKEVKSGTVVFQAITLPDACEEIVRDVLQAYIPRLLADEETVGKGSRKPEEVWKRVNGRLDTSMVGALRQQPGQ